MPETMTEAEEIVFYHSVGRLMDRWGYIDSLITQLCKDLTEKLRPPASGKVPWSLADRIAFVGNQFAVHVRLSPHHADVSDILEQVRQVDDTRSYIVHGCKAEFYRDPLAVQLTKLDRTSQRDGYQQLSMRVTFNALSELADASAAIVRGLISLSRIIEGLGKLG